jgi:hypothetical protein
MQTVTGTPKIYASLLIPVVGCQQKDFLSYARKTFNVYLEMEQNVFPPNED